MSVWDNYKLVVLYFLVMRRRKQMRRLTGPEGGGRGTGKKVGGGLVLDCTVWL